MKNITNKTKTILFASLIAAMVLPFAAMEMETASATAVGPTCGAPLSFFTTVIEGTNESDYIVGSQGHDLIYGYGGNDFIRGEGGYDCIYGGDGDDFIQGGSGNDKLHGDSGNDVIRSGDGNDWLYGEDGNDTLVGLGTHGEKFQNGGDGEDICIIMQTPDQLTRHNCEITDESVISYYN